MRFWAVPRPRVAILQRVGWARLSAALVVLGLLLIGCSRDDPGDDPAAGPDGTETDVLDADAADDAAVNDDVSDDEPLDEFVDPDAEQPGASDEADEADDVDQPDGRDEHPGDDGGQDGSGQDTSAPPVAPGPAGIVTIDGLGIAMQEARRCEPMDAQNIERDLDLQVIGEGPDGRVQLDIVVEEVGGMPRQALSLTLPDGRVLANDAQDFGSGWEDQRQQAMSGPPIEVSAGTARVDWMVYDPVGGVEELPVGVEVEVPRTTATCP